MALKNEVLPGTAAVIEKLNIAAEEAINSANVEELKRVYENMRGEFTELSKAFGTLTSIYAGELKTPRLIGQESDSAILAMKEVALAAIRLASLRFSKGGE